MSKSDVHYWLCEPYNEKLLNIDKVYDIQDLIINTLESKGLFIKKYSGNYKENKNIFLIHLIEFLYLNKYG
jgi:hypothetical protein